MATRERDEELEALPGRDREWDVDAAFARIAGGNVDGLKERLRELAQAYREDEDLHLSFDEVQTAVGGSQAQELTREQLAHVKNCRFCKELIDTVVGSEEERRLFLDLVQQHERKPVSDEPAHTVTPIPAHTSAAFEWRWPLATVASVAIVSVIGFPTLRPVLMAHLNPPPVEVKLSSIAYVDWTGAANTCKTQSEGVPSCDLLTAAAKLTTDGQNHLARPVLVTALRQAGVGDAALVKIDETLATLPKSTGNHSSRGGSSTSTQAGGQPQEGNDRSGATTSGMQAAPDALLVLAKQEFAAGERVRGYEQVASYIDEVTDRPGVARALENGFIEPVRKAESLKGARGAADQDKQGMAAK